ncbi:MAG: hypothetical protein GXY67_11090 [Clostridiales bacterium]|nr:hypothetical protein [Clostridiales bacterium]
MSTQPMKRQYIMLKPMVLGANGFARLEMEGGGLLLQLTGKNLTGHARGLRVFLYAGEGAVQELGGTRVNPQGQATLLAEIGPRQGGFSPTRLQAVLVTTDDPKPEPLFIGLCVPQSSGSLLDAKNALLALCTKLKESRAREAAARKREETEAKTEQDLGQRIGLREDMGQDPSIKYSVEDTAEKTGEQNGEDAKSQGVTPSAAKAHFALRASTAMPREFPPKEVFLSAIDPSVYVEADVYATRTPKRSVRAQEAGDKILESDAVVNLRRVDPPSPREGEDTGFQGDIGDNHFQPQTHGAGLGEVSPQNDAFFHRPRTPGAAPVDRLRPVRWPAQWRELSHYFDEYPSFAPFDMPGWRFVRVPMKRSGSFVLGRMCLDGKVQRVIYAVPGRRNQPPPKEFARYRWQQGRDGQGYWTLWQQVKGAAGS